MQKIKLIEEELKQLQDEEIELVHSFITRFNSTGLDSIYSDKERYEGDLPEDVSVNHDLYLYGDSK